MKPALLHLAAVLTLSLSSAFGHSDNEIGPNGGRILDFSKNQSIHGEVTVKDGKFHVALLDKDLKPLPIKEQSLTVTGGDRQKPEKLAVEKKGDYFVVPTVKEGQWAIFQFRETASAKPVTARLEYDTKPCPECKNPEWLCKCASAKDEKKKK